jgi:hypothetical protein
MLARRRVGTLEDNKSNDSGGEISVREVYDFRKSVEPYVLLALGPWMCANCV